MVGLTNPKPSATPPISLTEECLIISEERDRFISASLSVSTSSLEISAPLVEASTVMKIITATRVRITVQKVGLNKLDFKIPKNFEDKLFLIDSGKPKETTGEMVDFVRTSVNKKILNKIEKTVNKLVISIKNEDKVLFKKCLVNNEKLLEKLEVVSEKTKKLLINLSKFGFGKVTGAGGRKTDSGFILFFTEDKAKLEKFLKRKKISYYYFVPDYNGLQKI